MTSKIGHKVSGLLRNGPQITTLGYPILANSLPHCGPPGKGGLLTSLNAYDFKSIMRHDLSVNNLKAPANEKTLLQTHCFPKCFLGVQMRQHLLMKQSVSEQIQKHFCFHNKCFLGPQTGKHLLSEHCFLVCGHLKVSDKIKESLESLEVVIIKAALCSPLF